MFRRARIRLTVLYVVFFALVIGVFSLVFYVGFPTGEGGGDGVGGFLWCSRRRSILVRT